MGVSGISSSFLGLSQTSGQVPHVLLTRSPLGRPQCCHWLDPARLACIRHAASVRPEPGSNSPSRSLRPVPKPRTFDRGEPVSEGLSLVDRLAPGQTSFVRLSACTSDVRRRPRSGRTPALAFSSSIPFSRSAAGRWGRCAVPDAVETVGPTRCPPLAASLCGAAVRGELSTYSLPPVVSNTADARG